MTSENTKSIAIINSQGPLASSAGQESLDLVMAAGSFGQEVAVFFIGDGVYQLIKTQQPELAGVRHYSKGFAALPFYDIEDIYVCQASLEQRQLSTDTLSIKVELLQPRALADKLAHFDHLIRF